MLWMRALLIVSCLVPLACREREAPVPAPAARPADAAVEEGANCPIHRVECDTQGRCPICGGAPTDKPGAPVDG